MTMGEIVPANVPPTNTNRLNIVGSQPGPAAAVMPEHFDVVTSDRAIEVKERDPSRLAHGLSCGRRAQRSIRICARARFAIWYQPEPGALSPAHDYAASGRSSHDVSDWADTVVGNSVATTTRMRRARMRSWNHESHA